MADMQKKIDFNHKCVFFLITQNFHDKVFQDPRMEAGEAKGECMRAVTELLNWPAKLNNYMDECDDRHDKKRTEIVKQLQDKRDQLDKEIKDFQSGAQKQIIDQIKTLKVTQHFKLAETVRRNIEQMQEIRDTLMREEKALQIDKPDF